MIPTTIQSGGNRQPGFEAFRLVGPLREVGLLRSLLLPWVMRGPPLILLCAEEFGAGEVG
jgi:hypothetical protein